MKSSNFGVFATILLCIMSTAVGKNSPERQIAIRSKEEPMVFGIFQKHGRQAERVSMRRGSSLVLSDDDDDVDDGTLTQLPLGLTSVRRQLSHKLASIFTLCMFASGLYSWKFSNAAEWSGVHMLFMFSLVAYFWEALFCSTSRYLRNSWTPDRMDSYLESMNAVLPRVIWDIECFHYRTVQRVSYPSSSNNDDNGNRGQPQVRTEEEKVVTHRASAEYAFQSCKDVTDRRSLSRILEGIDSKEPFPKQFTKITLHKLLLFANDETYHDYVDQESRFRFLHQNRDVHHTFSSRLVMDRYVPKILVVNHSLGGVGTGLARFQWYLMFTFFGLTVPYRIWFSRHCSNTEVTLTKEVKK